MPRESLALKLKPLFVPPSLLPHSAPASKLRVSAWTGADPRGLMGWLPVPGQTPLHLAARGGSIGIVQELVKKGATVEAVDADGLTAGAVRRGAVCQVRSVALERKFPVPAVRPGFVSWFTPWRALAVALLSLFCSACRAKGRLLCVESFLHRPRSLFGWVLSVSDFVVHPLCTPPCPTDVMGREAEERGRTRCRRSG